HQYPPLDRDAARRPLRRDGAARTARRGHPRLLPPAARLISALGRFGSKADARIRGSMSALPLKADIERHDWHVCFVPIADKQVSLLCAKSGPPHARVITITPSVRRLDRHLADKLLSTGRLSEYSTDYFIGICIETSAVAEQNTLRLPRVDFPNCRLRLLPLEEQRQPHAEENLTIGMVHPGELCGRPPRLRGLIKFDVDDRIGEYQRL